MIVLADNDLILKLAQCELLDDLPRLLRLEETSQIFVSPTARFQLLPHSDEKALRKAGNSTTLDALKRFFQDTKELPAIQNEALWASMEGIAGIDGGEQFLLAAMVEFDQQRYLATGDKRALDAVAANEGLLSSTYAAIVDRVVTFESSLLLALTEFGFPNVKQRLLSCPKPDRMLSLVLKDGMREQDLVECLVSFSRAQYPFLAFKERLESYYQ